MVRSSLIIKQQINKCARKKRMDIHNRHRQEQNASNKKFDIKSWTDAACIKSVWFKMIVTPPQIVGALLKKPGQKSHLHIPSLDHQETKIRGIYIQDWINIIVNTN